MERRRAMDGGRVRADDVVQEGGYYRRASVGSAEHILHGIVPLVIVQR